MKLPFGRKGAKEETDLSFHGAEALLRIKPRERYVFHSDYYEVDDYVACILTFVHHDAASDNFGPFWGINRIPSGLPAGVSTVNLEQVSRMDEKWLLDHQDRSEQISNINSAEQGRGGTNKARNKAGRTASDLEVISRELTDGGSYLNVHDRILVKAPDIETLDTAVSKIERLYQERFATLEAKPHVGDQRRELSTLLSRNAAKKGKGFHFTSQEFAGSYSLVTHGLEDPAGEYVGYMVGDVNNSGIVMDTDNYKHHVVIASEQINSARGRAHVSDMWCSKLSQAALANGHRVTHIILNGADLMRLGPAFATITSTVDMGAGAINMFEMFGKVEDELSIFPSQMQKLILMAEQAYETTDSDRSIIRASLEGVATQFYVDNRMWYENAIANRERLRVVGLPHDEVPRLQMFVSYLDTEYKAMVNMTARDDEKLHAMSVLAATFRNLLSSNGDLFNRPTDAAVDDAARSQRVIYDLSGLMRRGKGVAMAQLVNAIGFACGQLGTGDVVVLHGVEHIDAGVRSYVDEKLDALFDAGGRVVYSYDHIDRMLADARFNRIDKADYSVLGNMTEVTVKDYQKVLSCEIPVDLQKLITVKTEAVCYVRRGYDNVVFQQSLQLDVRGD